MILKLVLDSMVLVHPEDFCHNLLFKIVQRDFLQPALKEVLFFAAVQCAPLQKLQRINMEGFPRPPL